MTISIVIPVYNSEKYLKESIESALNQTYNDIEIIAIDDGSTDSSLTILEKYSDKIKIVKQTNHGTASALNMGIKNSTGQWIKRLDPDDVLYPNAVEILIEATKTFGKDAESCIFYGNHQIISSSGKKIYDFINKNYNHLSNFEFGVILLDHNIVLPSDSIVHKSIFEKYGYYNERNRYSEDYEFFLRCKLLNNCKFFLVSKIITKYRMHKSQKNQNQS